MIGVAETKTKVPVDSNIYEKIQWVKEELLEANLKKSGENKFAGFKYYELADFLPTIIKLCKEVKLFTAPSFNKEEAMLIIVNINNPEEKVIYSSPMEELELKGCNKVQALGGAETYERRYLYMSAFDITENDMFDSTSTSGDEKQNILATENQLNFIKNIFENRVDELNKILANINKKKITELTIEEASKIISDNKE